jgi:hypothetical protein
MQAAPLAPFRRSAARPARAREAAQTPSLGG